MIGSLGEGGFGVILDGGGVEVAVVTDVAHEFVVFVVIVQ